MAHHSIHYSLLFVLDLVTLCNKFWEQLFLDPGWSLFLGNLMRGRLLGQTTVSGTAPGLKVATDTIISPFYNPFLFPLPLALLLSGLLGGPLIIMPFLGCGCSIYCQIWAENYPVNHQHF